MRDAPNLPGRATHFADATANAFFRAEARQTACGRLLSNVRSSPQWHAVDCQLCLRSYRRRKRFAREAK